MALNISGPLEEEGGVFETVIDFDLPQAKAIAVAILALVDWVERADARAKEAGE